MNRNQKAVFSGIILATGLLVFIPSIYVSVATKLGKLAELRAVGGV